MKKHTYYLWGAIVGFTSIFILAYLWVDSFFAGVAANM